MTPPSDEPTRKRSSADFVFGKVIGEGSFSTVYLAKDVHSNREFAIKVLEKRHIIREKKTEYVTREKNILQLLGSSCKYFVHLYFTFQDTERLYFVLSYAKNGELLQQINNKNNLFTLDCCRYYGAELVLALEYLNQKRIVHRDLKPENVLFDENGHILITDFGSAKILDNNESSDEENQKRRKYSFVGTAQYVSPEILNDEGSSCASDLWALGCIIYQMVAGQMPFRGTSEYLIFQKIIHLNYEFPDGFDNQARDLVEKFLVIAPNERLGATDQVPYTSIRQHEFFRTINWEDLGPPPVKFACDTNRLDSIIPDDLEPGLDEQKATRLHLDMLQPPSTPPTRKKSEPNRKITDLNESEIEQRLEMQKSNNAYHELVEGNLILKQGIIEKKKGLFPRRRMLLLTMGPHLYYVDPTTMILKGEIPWSEELKAEAKNFKKFFVHTPNRIYYLEDPDGYALEWCKAIEEVKTYYYPEQAT